MDDGMADQKANDEPAATSRPSSPTKQRSLHRYSTRRPAELEAGPVDKDEYARYRAHTDLREPYRIPATYLAHTKKFYAPDLPEAPLIVFINSRSGGRAGAKLTETLYRTLGHAQVFDLQEYHPGPVLQQIWKNLGRSAERGDARAPIIQRKMRVLAAGGDGTVVWILKTVFECGLVPEPSVAVMPLGTGNDLSLSLGWGNTFLRAWINRHVTIYETLKRIGDAEERNMDAWHIALSSDEAGEELFEQLPHSLDTKACAGEPVHKVRGLFWNYFSVGLDAEAAYRFHALREAHPWATSGRLINQAWYAAFSCATGWFCCAPPLNARATLRVRDMAGGAWRTVRLSERIKALVVLNLQSYGGGRDLWGLSTGGKKQWRTPIFNDGLIEVVGLRSGWHTAAVMGGCVPRLHAARLAQAAEVVLEVRGRGGERPGLTHMQLDGEPWPQAIPSHDSQPLRVHIAHAGSSRMLFNPTRLKGIAPKIQKLAQRQHVVSADTDSALFSPSGYTPRTPYTPYVPGQMGLQMGPLDGPRSHANGDVLPHAEALATLSGPAEGASTLSAAANGAPSENGGTALVMNGAHHASNGLQPRAAGETDAADSGGLEVNSLPRSAGDLHLQLPSHERDQARAGPGQAG